jgi:predicted HD phosphohydrolase
MLCDWAKEVARELLGQCPRRLGHAEGVVQRAFELKWSLERKSDYDLLLAACYLHDIGYSPYVAQSGFHALDGARYLRALGATKRVTALVAHHCGARYEATIRGLERQLAPFDYEDSYLSACLDYCDLTTGPTGEWFSPDESLTWFVNLENRYDSDWAAAKAVRLAWPELSRSIARVEKQLAEGPELQPSSVVELER